MAVNKKIVEKVDKIMDETVAYIVEKYGEVKPEWNGALDMLRTQYTILFECKEIVEKDGVMEVGRVLPTEYTHFYGDGERNWFRTDWRSKEFWDWSWDNPYEEDLNG